MSSHPLLPVQFHSDTIYCPTQGGVKPPPLGGGFSVSFVVCGHEQLLQRFPQCFFNSPAPGLDTQVPEKDFVR